MRDGGAVNPSDPGFSYSTLKRTADLLRCAPEQVPDRVASLLEQVERLGRESDEQHDRLNELEGELRDAPRLDLELFWKPEPATF